MSEVRSSPAMVISAASDGSGGRGTVQEGAGPAGCPRAAHLAGRNHRESCLDPCSMHQLQLQFLSRP